MTVPAWIMLGVTWGVIGFFTIRFFGRILRARASMAAPGGDRGDDPPCDVGGLGEPGYLGDPSDPGEPGERPTGRGRS